MHYPFLIINTARKNHRGVHWWSILDIDPKKELFLFDSEEFEGFKYFITSDNNAIVDKVLYNVERFGKKDKKITCVTITFSVPGYRKLKEDEINKLSTTAQDLFHLFLEFSFYKRHENDLKIVFVDDQLQKFDTSTSGNFHLYFYKHLFDPKKESNRINDTKLTKKTIDKLLNETFTLNQDENEERVTEFLDLFNVKHDWTGI